MVKHVVSKTWTLLPGADGRLRSVDQFGLVGYGLSEDEVRSEEVRKLTEEARAESAAKGWTLSETREFLLAQLKQRNSGAELPYELLLQAQITLAKYTTDDGDAINVAAVPWNAIYDAINKDSDFLAHFAKHPRAFEEFIAGAYDTAGWDEVILTPRSADGGRDVIAIKNGFGSIRFLEQTKAYKPGHLVTHNDVRAMLGVLQTDANSSKVLITTTSDFQPAILAGKEFKPFLPHRLELKNGVQLMKWLELIRQGEKK